MMTRLKTLAAGAVALALISAPALAVDLSNMNAAERDAFREEVRAYLLDHPEVIIEAVQLLEQRQADEQASADLALVADNMDELVNDGYSWVGGNPDGDITLVEFMDYRCAYCRRAQAEVAALLHSDGNIRLIIKELPILGEASTISSRFAIATRQVAGDDAYELVHDALMSFNAEPTPAALRRLSEGLDIDGEPILAAMDSDAVTEEIARTHALARKLRINGTPTFMLHDELLRGYLQADQMAAIVADKRNK